MTINQSTPDNPHDVMPEENVLTDAESEMANDVIYEMNEMFTEIMDAAGDMENAPPIMLNTSLYCVVKIMADAGVPESYVHELINNIYTILHNGKLKP